MPGFENGVTQPHVTNAFYEGERDGILVTTGEQRKTEGVLGKVRTFNPDSEVVKGWITEGLLNTPVAYEDVTPKHGSLADMLEEVEALKAAKAADDATIASVDAEIAAQELALEGMKQRRNDLQSAMSMREEQIKALSTCIETKQSEAQQALQAVANSLGLTIPELIKLGAPRT